LRTGALIAAASLVALAGCSGQSGQGPGPAPESRVTGGPVSYRSGTDTVRGVLYRPAGEGPFPAVVVVHSDFGLTKWVEAQAKRLAEKGYVALAVDLYRGEKVADVMDAHILDRAMPGERVLGDLKAAVDYLVSRPDVRKEALGIIGWGSGGGNALDAALADRRLRAVVTCYGRLTTDAELLKPLNASVLGIFAGEDEGISPETVATFRAAMAKAGKRVTTQTYKDVGHGFMDPTGPDRPGPMAAEATADAWKRIESFLAAELKP
jgi:carboxymethylenebutenolidase